MNILTLLQYYCFLAVYCFLGFVIGEMATRVLYITKEFLEGRHQNENNIISCTNLLNDLTTKKLLYSLAFISIAIYTSDYIQNKMQQEGFSLLLIISLVYCLQKTYKILESKQDIINFIQSDTGLDYGSGMAHSYFYGYLNKILPNRGDENVGIKENIEKYEAQENVTFRAKKLFILIPLSMHFSPSLSEHVPDEIMEACKSLGEIEQNVAGVMRRSYKNSVYKIHLRLLRGSNESPVYVVAEGATPLHTLYQTCTGRVPACSEGIREHSEEIVMQFYRTLSRILESFPEYRDTYELIVYKGDENIAELMVQRIEST